ncbi:MAG TPA: phosphatase PAP2 family protein [Vicinamibacterales bacterium]|nr:phosphatase PAP2 family protein [Vicinamibacterales bacterium]
MRGFLRLTYFTIIVMTTASGVSQAQASDPPGVSMSDAAPPAALSGPSLLGSFDTDVLFARQPAGPPPTPRHTGIKAMAKHVVTNFRYLPTTENLLWAGAGGGLALAAHPFDDDVNRALVGNTTAENFFKPGAVLGALYTLLPSAAVVYTVGRINDQPKVSHLGMDLIEALAMSEALTAALKYTTRRERPDGSGKNSFPSGHAADTFAFATALERHLNWRMSVPAYIFASYVAISRLPANRHWLSDVVFGSAVGIIAGRTVTSNEAERPYPVAVAIIPGGAAVMYVRNR